MSGDAEPARRELVLVALACAAGAGLALFAVTRSWAVDVTTRPAPLPELRTTRSGTSVAPWVWPLALVALAGVGALPATRRTGRLAVGVLLCVVGVAVAAGGLVGLTTVDGVRVAWPLLCVLAGGLVAGCGALAAGRGHRWPAMGTRYERRAEPAPRTPATGRVPDKELWEALDRGEDPTAG
jgi:hypothetical protein